MSKKIAVVDTMVFLHWPLFINLDWKAIVNASSVVILIPSTVFYEIDKNKDKNSSNTIRKRARKVLVEIENRIGASESAVLGEGVNLHLDLKNYTDFEAYELSPSVKDDDILLAALKWREQGQDEVVIVSGDSTMRTKARRRGFEVFTPHEDDRIEDPLDDYQRTIADLNQQLLSARSREPQLKVVHQDNEPVLVYQPESIFPSAEAYVAERLSVFRQHYPLLKLGSYPSSIRPGDERPEYNQKLQAFYVEVEDSLRKGFENMLLRNRGFWCDLDIANNGGGPASHVRIQITAPDGVRLYDVLNAPSALAIPPAPDKPLDPGSVFVPSKFSTSTPKSAPKQKVEWKIEQYKVATREITSVIQHAPQPLPGLFVLPTDTTSDRGFHLDIRITCAELAEPVAHQLHFRYIAPDGAHIDAGATEAFTENLKLFHLTLIEEYEEMINRKS